MSRRLSRRFTLAALACSACLFSNAAFAEVNATSRLFNTGFQLIDLDTTDGITPELVFSNTPWSGGYSNITASNDNYPYASDYKHHHDRQAFSSSVSAGDSSVSVNYSGGGYFANYAVAGTTASGNFSGYSSQSIVFYLTPKTRLVVFGDAEASLQFSGQREARGFAYSYASLSNWTDSGHDVNYSGLIDGDSSWIKDKHISEHFSINMDNNADHQITGYMNLSAQVNATSGPAPIPEPETWAMMLGGLAALAAVARRRQKQA
ncbi:MAG: PEP-CTERM sorting domain-containing protein [Burkholderiales bacterium]|nr:PEP-CTERM sorting domain-containing protein [Burkholderiales bacterium]